MAAHTLSRMGYEAAVIEGGMGAWKKAGLPVEGRSVARQIFSGPGLGPETRNRRSLPARPFGGAASGPELGWSGGFEVR